MINNNQNILQQDCKEGQGLGSVTRRDALKCGSPKNLFADNQITKWIEESEEETKAYEKEQSFKDIEYLLIMKPKQEKINKEMSKFIEGLK